MIYMIDYSPLFLYPPLHNLGNKNWFYKLLQADIAGGGVLIIWLFVDDTLECRRAHFNFFILQLTVVW